MTPEMIAALLGWGGPGVVILGLSYAVVHLSKRYEASQTARVSDLREIAALAQATTSSNIAMMKVVEDRTRALEAMTSTLERVAQQLSDMAEKHKKLVEQVESADRRIASLLDRKA